MNKAGQESVDYTVANASRRPWETMSMRYVGQVQQIVAGGGGKLTPPASDPGEPRKTQPSG